MADTVALNKVLLGDTTAEVVEKINKGLTKTDNNEISIASIESAVNALEDAVANAGKVDDVKVNGESVVTEKVANITVPTKVSELNNDSGYISSTEKGAKNGIATLDENGLVPSSQLPSYVDDVLEYDSQSAFPETGETGKIYLAKDNNKQYRWSGTQYVEISSSLALGITSSTAYAGDKGKANADDIAKIKADYVGADGHLTEYTIILGDISNQETNYRAIKSSTVKILPKNTSLGIGDSYGVNNTTEAVSDHVVLTGAKTYDIIVSQMLYVILNSTHFDVATANGYKTYTGKSTIVKNVFPLHLINAEKKQLVAELSWNDNGYVVITVDATKDLFATNHYIVVRSKG